MDTTAIRIKAIRKARKLTQKEVANRAKINVVLLQQYEYGLKKPKFEQAEKIAQALEVDVAFLLPSHTDSPMAIYALLFDLIQKYGNITFEQKGGTVYFGIDCPKKDPVHRKLSAAMSAHKKLSLEDFKKWLINQPTLIQSGKIVER